MNAWFERQEYGDYGLSQDNVLTNKPDPVHSKATEMTPEKSNTLPFTSRRKKIEDKRGRQTDRLRGPDRIKSRDSSLSSVHSVRSVQSVNSVHSAYSAGGGRRRRRKRKNSSHSVRSGSMDNIQVTCGQSNKREVKVDSKYGYPKRGNEQMDSDYSNYRSYRRSQERLDTGYHRHSQERLDRDERFDRNRDGRFGRGRGREKYDGRNERFIRNKDAEKFDRNTDKDDRNSERADKSNDFDRSSRNKENNYVQDGERTRDRRDNYSKQQFGRGRGRTDHYDQVSKPGNKYDDRRGKGEANRGHETRTKTDDSRDRWKKGDKSGNNRGSVRESNRSRSYSGNDDKLSEGGTPPRQGGLIHLPPQQPEAPEPPVSPGPRHDFHEPHSGRDVPRGRGIGRARQDSGSGRKTLFDPKNPSKPIVISEGKPQLEFKDTDEYSSSPQSPQQYPPIPPGRGPGMYPYGPYGTPGYGYGYPVSPPFTPHGMVPPGMGPPGMGMMPPPPPPMSAEGMFYGYPPPYQDSGPYQDDVYARDPYYNG